MYLCFRGCPGRPSATFTANPSPERVVTDTLASGAKRISPARAGQRLRLDAARHLLATTSRTVTDIAHATGFCDASHLINMFRGAFGVSPAEFRRGGPRARDLTRPSSDVGDSFDEKLAEALYRA